MDKEKNVELSQEEMKKATGGCTSPDGTYTRCVWEKTGNKVVGYGTDAGVTYWEYRCINCGAVEYFRRNPN